MLKTISAALLAVSVLAAPALAATTKTTQAPATKSAQVNEASKANKSALNANAKMGRHHVRHSGHHRVHKKMVTHKSHNSPKVAVKRFAPPAKRG